MNQIIRGDGSFGFVAFIDHDDLVVEDVVCSWFGGRHDPGDNGETASGINTRDNPDIRGAALPMDGFHHPATNGSPIPKIPWKTLITVTNRQDRNGATKSFPLIDLGPSKNAASHAAIDLTPPAFESLGGDLQAGLLRVNYRIVNGAQFVPGSAIPSVSLRSSTIPRMQLAESALTWRDDGHGSSNPNPKPPIKQFIESPNHSSRNGVKIKNIVLHCTEGSTAQGAINEFLNPSGRRVSAHYIVDRNGDIYQMVDDADVANHCKGANQNSIGIEHVALESQAMADPQRDSSVALIKFLMNRYSIDTKNIFGHDFTPGYNGGGTSCPDHLFGQAHTQDVVSAWLVANNIG
jgi:N-acetylmuramoyl-L-alanine amidase